MRSRRFYIQWHLVDRCNLRCQHCYQDDFSAEQELSFSSLKEIASNLFKSMEKWQSKLKVVLTGGEPFLKKELPELMEYLNGSSRVIEISIITNGLFFPRWLEEIKHITKFKEIMVSLDGVTSATNDSIRGKGTFSQIMAGIRKFRELDIPLIIMFTTMKRNQSEAPMLFDLAREIGARGFIIERFFPLGQGKNLDKEALSGTEFLYLWQKVLNHCRTKASPEELIPYRAIKVELGRLKPEVYGSECIIGRDGLALMPGGNVFPCRRFPLPLGNLLNEPLDEIWKNAGFIRDLRNKKKLKGKCHSCAIKDCIGCRAMSYALTGDPFAPDPNCWL